jgi:myo-inositol-1-phosphate synthase
VLDSIVGYRVENHQVHIHYYKPRGDAKEAWDNIDIGGFCGVPMQMKVNFLCQDSILAAPLVIDMCALVDVAKAQRREGHPAPAVALLQVALRVARRAAHPRPVQAGEDPARLGRRARQAAQVTTSGPRRGP